MAADDLLEQVFSRVKPPEVEAAELREQNGFLDTVEEVHVVEHHSHEHHENGGEPVSHHSYERHEVVVSPEAHHLHEHHEDVILCLLTSIF